MADSLPGFTLHSKKNHRKRENAKPKVATKPVTESLTFSPLMIVTKQEKVGAFAARLN